MSLPFRLLVPACLVAAVLAGCGSPAPTGSAASSAIASATPSADSELLPGYIAGICPVFDALVVVDPRLSELRALAAEGGDLKSQGDEIASLSDDILVLLEQLESLPDWEPGAALRFQLRDSLHGIRARLLIVERDSDAANVAALIEAMPFIATDALDRAMSVASQGGLVCDSAL